MGSRVLLDMDIYIRYCNVFEHNSLSPLPHFNYTPPHALMYLNELLLCGYEKDSPSRNFWLDHQIEGMKPEAKFIIYVISPP